MNPLAQRIRETEPSPTIAIADAVAAMRRKGEAVLDFSAGRAAEHTPEYVTEAAVLAMKGGDTHQTPARGRPEFLAAAAAKLRRENGIEADPERHLLATLGCKQGLLLAVLATMNPGDEVIVEDPCFVSYGPTLRFGGATPVPVPLRRENRFRWTSDDLARRLTPRTRAIVLCSPHNPTGVVHTESDLEVVSAFARTNDLLVIADETYERLTWGGRRHVSVAARAGMAERTITLMGLTKSFAMGGWRIGFAQGPSSIVEAMVNLQAHLQTCAGSFAQTGATIALGSPPRPEVLSLWREWEERCQYAVAELDRIPGCSCALPDGGYYAWIDVTGTGSSSSELARRLLAGSQVAVVPGTAFGAQGEGFLRMTCVQSWDVLREGLSRIRTALS
jgi:aspartate/methionine/tyrosine aminotransferase